MTSAIEAVVAAYVHTNQLGVLLDLKSHREQMVASIRSRTDFDFGILLGQLDDDIRAIDLGIRRLRAVREPRNESDT